MSVLLYLTIPALILLHLWLSPYTKVEESFNIQATHDVLTYGVPTNNAEIKFKTFYDHMTFPGAVPRTFVGALVLSAIAKPFVWYGNLKLAQQQLLVRAILGIFNAAALLFYSSGVRKAFGKPTHIWYLALQASQFHILYYSSRLLPNMYAFGITTIASRFLLPDSTASMPPIKRARLAIYLLTLCTIIFRSEIALLLGSHCLYMLVKSPNMSSRFTVIQSTFLPAILSATVAGLSLTVSIDTYFWQHKRLLWPELAAFLSNIFPKDGESGASAWGTQPWHWYFTSALSRLVPNPLLRLLLPYGIMTTLRPQLLDLLIPNLGYVILYSILPHKETRFLFPVMPQLTTAFALVASYISNRGSRSIFYKAATTILILSTVVTAFISHAIILPLSAQTYYGGVALQSLHTHSENYPPEQHIHVHLTNLALQTGVSRFLQHPPPSRPLVIMQGSADGSRPSLKSGATYWHYDKSDNETKFLTPVFWNRFDYAIVEDPARAIGMWDVIDKIQGLGRPSLTGPDVGRGMLVLGGKSERRETDGLKRIVKALYGERLAWLYAVFHDVIREGYGVRSVLGQNWSWTKGWWIHWGLENKLFVLRRSEDWARLQ